MYRVVQVTLNKNTDRNVLFNEPLIIWHRIKGIERTWATSQLGTFTWAGIYDHMFRFDASLLSLGYFWFRWPQKPKTRNGCFQATAEIVRPSDCPSIVWHKSLALQTIVSRLPMPLSRLPSPSGIRTRTRKNGKLWPPQREICAYNVWKYVHIEQCGINMVIDSSESCCCCPFFVNSQSNWRKMKI